MPYIKQKDRERLAKGEAPQTAGELNYSITKLLLNYLKAKGTSYQTINEIMGVMSAATHEFYRRHAVPYEDKKIAENGDVAPDSDNEFDNGD
jgi:hypothetical protein